MYRLVVFLEHAMKICKDGMESLLQVQLMLLS